MFISLKKRACSRRFARLLANLARAVCVIALSSLIAATTACSSMGSQPGMSNKGARDDLFMVSLNAQRAYQESRWLDAVRLYQQIVEQVPSDAVAWFRLANTYAQQGAFERAVHAYEQSLAHDSEQPKAWFNLSTAYLLKAQSAMQQATTQMRSRDPAREMIDKRLQTLGNLIHRRVEENESL
ncbi:MAG: tetratricopeptide repeat protein [Granulosicoccus sp.]